MKAGLFLLFNTLLLISCKELDITKYEYRSTTMTGRTVVSITQDSTIISFTGRGEPTRTARGTSSTEWASLAKAMEGVDLSKIASLEAPSNKRATDAAPFGSIEITSKDTVYTSASFDGKNPHEMLMPLMNEIVKIWEKK
ncbi:MAG: hypothetical protein IPM74_04495 [Crocinitomicaceae bacterium]|nr:hypothetical protein [Crocinitomicaceae bacterium]MBK8925169.1 hypothetical protein [Crocinitomicaceae bacterium]